METKTINLGLQTRTLTIDRAGINDEKRTVDFTFSSETPYERYWGIEILSHKKSHVDMSFMGKGTAPLLVGHNHDDQVAVIEKAWVQEGAGHARARFGKSDRATEIFNDVIDGIRGNISVGYHVKKMVLREENEDGPNEYLITKWQPVEASIVAVPADPTVGIKAADHDEIETIIEFETKKKEASKMPEDKTKETPAIDINAEREKIRIEERNRQGDIMSIGKISGMEDEAAKAVKSGESVADFRARAFDKMTDELKSKPPAVDMDSLSEGDKKDLASYSFVKAIRETGEGKLTGFEAEMNTEGKKQFKDSGRAPQGNLAVPYQVLAQRDLTVGTDDQGGYTVATNLLAGSFIELLQNAMMVKQMGATVLDNLTGDVAIPSQATGATAAWEGENDAGSESSPTFGQLALSPNRVGTYTEVSKKLLVQSSLSVEAIVRQLLIDSVALAMDLAALHGTGSNDQPTGVASTGSIGSVAGGTNGLAPTWAHIVELETDVAVGNALNGRLGYMTNAKVRGKLKTTMRVATYGDIPIWDVGTPGAPLNGYPVGVTNQVSSALTKGSSSGVCSAIFFGNWADLVAAFWGGMDMVVDPYSLATTNLTRITLNTYADVGVRHAASFSAMLDALTA